LPDDFISSDDFPDNDLQEQTRRKPIHERIADSIMNQYTLKTMRDNEDMYYYNETKGVYAFEAERLIKEYCYSVKPDVRAILVREVTNNINGRTGVDREQFDSNRNLINFQNCVLDFNTGQILEHQPDMLFLSQIPHTYYPGAKCPKIMKFLKEVLPQRSILTAMEFLGYCLLRSTAYEKALMCVGEASSGKSTFLKLFDCLLGIENTGHESLQDLCHDRFKGVQLYGRLANIYADLRADKITDTGRFKMYVSGDRMSIQRKYGQPFDFNNYAKLIFSANEIPVSYDESDAYFRRWIMMVFEHPFIGEYKNINLIDELTTEEEMSGLINLALIGLRKLIKDGRFIMEPEDWEDAKLIYEEHSSSKTIERFIEDCCLRTYKEDDEENVIISRDLYHQYLKYCESKRKSFEHDNVFGKKLRQMGLKKRRLRVGNEPEYCILGIKWMPKLKEGSISSDV
jgi:P4 family phage/plasmid primase-like protien